MEPAGRLPGSESSGALPPTAALGKLPVPAHVRAVEGPGHRAARARRRHRLRSGVVHAGRGLKQTHQYRRGCCFNEAPTDRRGRRRATRALKAQKAMLQRNPGGSPGETRPSVVFDVAKFDWLQRNPGGSPGETKSSGGGTRRSTTGFETPADRRGRLSPPFDDFANIRGSFNETPADRRGRQVRAALGSRVALIASTKPRRIAGGDSRSQPTSTRCRRSFNETPADRRGRLHHSNPIDCLGESRRVASTREKSPGSQAKQPVLVRRLSKIRSYLNRL